MENGEWARPLPNLFLDCHNLRFRNYVTVLDVEVASADTTRVVLRQCHGSGRSANIADPLWEKKCKRHPTEDPGSYLHLASRIISSFFTPVWEPAHFALELSHKRWQGCPASRTLGRIGEQASTNMRPMKRLPGMSGSTSPH